ncbi:hypothetical protein MRX96_019066 [Rhipicephalus microplus]
MVPSVVHRLLVAAQRASREFQLVGRPNPLGGGVSKTGAECEVGEAHPLAAERDRCARGPVPFFVASGRWMVDEGSTAPARPASMNGNRIDLADDFAPPPSLVLPSPVPLIDP